jgi:hypothetical protein
VAAERLSLAARCSRGPDGVPSPSRFRLTEDDLFEGWRWKAGREWRTVIRWPGATGEDATAIRRARGRSRLDVFVDEDGTASLIAQIVPMTSAAHAGRWLARAAETQMGGRFASIQAVVPVDADYADVGDERRAWSNEGLKTSRPGPVEDLCIAWRRGPVGAALIAGGPPGTWTMDAVADVARRQDALIREGLLDEPGDSSAPRTT